MKGMMIMKHIKHLKLEGAYNIRDLGGYALANKHMSKWNTLYRGDNLHSLTKGDWLSLYASNVRCVIDLRSSSERSHDGYDCEQYGIKNLHIPLQNDDIDMRKMKDMVAGGFWSSLTEGYMQMIQSNQSNIVNVFEAIGEYISDGAVLFHCTAGKDRTGLIAALLLMLVEAQKEDIIADYEVSATYNHKGIGTNNLLSKIPAQYQHLLLSDPHNLDGILQYFEENPLNKYLINSGLKQSTLETIWEYFID